MNLPPLNKQRALSFEMLRVFATLAVVFIHSVSTVELVAIQNGLQGYSLSLLNEVISHAAVPSFLFINGFFVWSKDFSNKDTAAFTKKRLRRILAPYLVWCFIYIAWALAIAPADSLQSQFGLGGALLNILFGRVQYPFYFIPSFLLITLLAPWLSKFTQRYPAAFIVVATLAATILNGLIPRDLSSSSSIIIIRDFFVITIEFLPFVALGSWYAKQKEHVVGATMPIMLSMAGLIAVFLSQAFDNAFLQAFLHLITSFMFILSLITLFKLTEKHICSSRSTFIQKLGKLSYEVYLSHVLLLTVAWVALDKLHLLPSAMWAAELALFTVASIGCYVLSWAIDKVGAYLGTIKN